MKSIWFSNGRGIAIFNAVGNEYYKVHGVYPNVHYEMIEFLGKLGYECEYVIKNYSESKYGIAEKGIRMDEQTAMALILRFG